VLGGRPCIGYWPGGGLGGQTVDQGIDSLVLSLREMGKVAADNELMLSVEIEPPFAFNTIDHLIRLIDGADHASVRAMFDPSHFDVMSGGRGRPHELLERLGVHRVGYVHFTDSDGTLHGGTSKHLPAGAGHIDLERSMQVLWEGGFDGWRMIDTWMTPDPYEAGRRGRLAIETFRRNAGRRAGGSGLGR